MVEHSSRILASEEKAITTLVVEHVQPVLSVLFDVSVLLLLLLLLLLFFINVFPFCFTISTSIPRNGGSGQRILF